MKNILTKGTFPLQIFKSDKNISNAQNNYIGYNKNYSYLECETFGVLFNGWEVTQKYLFLTCIFFKTSP